MRTDILTEHSEEIEILWSRRRAALWSPRETLDTLAALERRLDAHIDGLALDLDGAHECFERGLAGDDADAAFASAATLLRQRAPSAQDRVLEALRVAKPGAAVGITDALAYEPLAPAVVERLGHLPWLSPPHRSWSLVRRTLWSHRGSQLPGIYPDLETLREEWCRPGTASEIGIFLLGCTGSDDDVVRLVDMIARDERVESALRALGSLGRPVAAEALLGLMGDERTAPGAGEAFWRITGLAVVPRDDVQAGDSDERFEEVRPWPDAARTRALWETQSRAFTGGGRWRYGCPIECRRWLAEPHAGDLLTRREEISRLRTEQRGALANLDLDAPASRQRSWASSREGKP